MIAFARGNTRFNFRVVACALHEGRVLMHRAEQDDFWALPGGRGELLEPSVETLRREMREELGVEVQVERLVWIVENFYGNADARFHEIALYYLISFPPGSPLYAQEEFFGDEEGLRLIFRWQSIDTLEQVRFYPSFLRAAMKSIPSGVEHVVHTDTDE